MAGLSEHDFSEQVTTNGTRPDFVVALPQEGVIPADSSDWSPLFASGRIGPGPEQDNLIRKHAAAMKGHITELSKKSSRRTLRVNSTMW